MSMLRRVARHRWGWLAALALTLTAGVIVALVLVAGSPSPMTAAGAAKTPAGAATVKRRNLVQTDTEAGTLSYANPETVYDRLSGTITWLPGVGQVIRPGGTLFRVNGAPVILMNGNTPAYRTLSAADGDGADVLELNRNLVALGFNANGITVDDVWQPATTLGVELLQESLGETATGTLSLGKVVFLPGPQLVSTVEGTIGNTANGGSSGTPASGAAGPLAPEFVSLTTPATATTTATTRSSTATTTTAPTTPTTTTPTTTTPTTTAPQPTGKHHHKPRKRTAQTPSLAALLALLKAESAQLKAEAEQLKAEQGGHGNTPSGNSPSGNSNSSNKGANNNGSATGNNAANSGDIGSTGEAVLETTSTHLVVTVDLDASLQSEAKVGERVMVQLPAGNTVNGKVTAVSSVAQSPSSGDNSGGTGGSGSGGGGGGNGGGGGGGGSGSGASSTIPVTITLSGRHRGAGLDEAAVSVSFAQQRANNVLSVPVTALVAVSGGNYAVQEAAAPHTLVPVSVGLFAAGYVQISGPGIHTGLQVTDSQG
jgi:hypothetical protein